MRSTVLSKDHSWRTAENRWVSGSEKKKNGQTASTSPHVVWEDFKKNYPHSLIQKQSPAYSVVRHDWNFQNGTGFYGQMKLKMSFLAATLKIIKSTPCVKWNIMRISDVVEPIFLLEVLAVLFKHIMDIKYKQIKNHKWLRAYILICNNWLI